MMPIVTTGTQLLFLIRDIPPLEFITPHLGLEFCPQVASLRADCFPLREKNLDDGNPILQTRKPEKSLLMATGLIPSSTVRVDTLNLG